MVNNVLLVALGGGIGSVLRFLCQKQFNLSFPYGTLAVNLIGCLLIGLFWGLFKDLPEEKRVFWMTGLCGGFTTFSSFTLEGMNMIHQERWLAFFIYTMISVALGITATMIGYKISLQA